MILHESWRAALAQQPETGMGFQVLELQHDPYGTVRHALVLNGMDAREWSRGSLAVREEVEQAADTVLRALEGEVGRTFFRVLSRSEAENVGALESAAVGDGPADGAPIEESLPGESFLRFSAYANDCRILTDGSVTPGTYVTTREDGMTYVKSGMDAVRRYALPSPEPAVHRYQLEPPRLILVRRGTVRPAFGQPGGGVEAIFERGAPAGTRRKQDEIPPR